MNHWRLDYMFNIWPLNIELAIANCIKNLSKDFESFNFTFKLKQIE